MQGILAGGDTQKAQRDGSCLATLAGTQLKQAARPPQAQHQPALPGGAQEQLSHPKGSSPGTAQPSLGALQRSRRFPGIPLPRAPAHRHGQGGKKCHGHLQRHLDGNAGTPEKVPSLQQSSCSSSRHNSLQRGQSCLQSCFQRLGACVVSGPGRLCTINLSVENSTYLNHLSPAKGKSVSQKHQAFDFTHATPTRNQGRCESLTLPLATARETQRGSETKGAEQSSQARAGLI